MNVPSEAECDDINDVICTDVEELIAKSEVFHVLGIYNSSDFGHHCSDVLEMVKRILTESVMAEPTMILLITDLMNSIKEE